MVKNILIILIKVIVIALGAVWIASLMIMDGK